MLQTYHADFAIMSTAGVDLNFGFSEQVEGQSRIKRIMIANAATKIAMVDHSKFDRINLCHTCDIKDMDVIIYNGQLNPEYPKKAPSVQWIDALGDHSEL